MLTTPLCTMEQYAYLVGVSVDVVRGWQARGYLPTAKVGRYTLVNLVAIAQSLAVDPCAAKPGMSAYGVGTPSVPAREDGRRQATASGRGRGRCRPLSNHGDNLSGGAQEVVL